MEGQTDNQQRKVNEIDLAWLAGLWDGEGSLGMKVQKYKADGKTYFEPYAQVVNTHQGTLERVDRILTDLHVGHHISWPKPHPWGGRQPAQYKPLWSVRINGLRRVKSLLIWLKPYLTTKAEQAALLWEYIEGREEHEYKHHWAYSDRELEIVNSFRLRSHSGKATKAISLESLNDYMREVPA